MNTIVPALRLLIQLKDLTSNNETFVRRLMDEYAWTRSYARRCIQEYKNFLCLVMYSKEKLIPSAAVDKVWFTHTQFTMDYYRYFEYLNETFIPKWECRELRRSDINSTLELYNKILDQTPPEDIWMYCDIFEMLEYKFDRFMQKVSTRLGVKSLLAGLSNKLGKFRWS